MKKSQSFRVPLVSALALLVTMSGASSAWAQSPESNRPKAADGASENAGKVTPSGKVDKDKTASRPDAKKDQRAAQPSDEDKAKSNAPAAPAPVEPTPQAPAESKAPTKPKAPAQAKGDEASAAAASPSAAATTADPAQVTKDQAAADKPKSKHSSDKKKASTAKKASPLAPPEQAASLGKHPVNNEKNTYKPGTGLILESDDGRFSVGTRLRLQLRYSVAHDAEADPKLKHVFQLRRARLQFKGHTFSKHNKYKAEFAFSPRDLGMKNGVPHRTPLLTWYLEFDHLRDLTVRAGQYKIPYSRQRVVSSGDLQLVDRALANGEFNHDRDIGFDLRSKDLFGLGGYLRYYAGVYMGEGRDFGDKNATPDFKLHYLGRIEVLPLGPFKDYKEADMYRSAKPKLSLGGAYAFHHQSQGLRGVLGTTASDEGTTDYHSANVDYVFKYAGFSSTGEFHWRKGTRLPGDATIEDPNDATATLPAPVEAARNGLGWFVQAGYLFPRLPIELAARYSAIRGIGKKDTGDLSDATGYTSLGKKDAVALGLSYYVAGHPWKIQTDYIRGWDDGDFDKGNSLWRIQLQLAL